MNHGTRFDHARQIADAVLYEGYLLYPYRASSSKNQIRWQFGVLTPPSWSDRGSGEPKANQTEVIVEAGDHTVLCVRVRFLQIQARIIERATDPLGQEFSEVASLTVDGETIMTWDNAIEREIDIDVSLDALALGEQQHRFEFSEFCDSTPLVSASGELVGREIQRQWPVSGIARISAESLDGPYGISRLRISIENASDWLDPEATREGALRHSLIATHVLMSLDGGSFMSLLDYPEWAKHAVASCENLNIFPILVGDQGQRDTMLSSPLILYDYPNIAPESQGDLFDATEIDEILLLRTMTLTDDEKQEARATDSRAAAIVDRADNIPAEMLERLHGAVRYLQQVTGKAEPAQIPEEIPWWGDSALGTPTSSTDDQINIDGIGVARGSEVRLKPGVRRTDAQDMFLVGRVATVEAVLTDLEDKRYLAVTLQDDPGADLRKAHGRFLYFSPEEVEPLEASR